MKIVVHTLILMIFTGFMLKSTVKAEYYLPYPSYMPGNKLYKVSMLIDKLENFWYWGNIAQVKYHLKLSDKYLVEAKTLFEYNQYLLGADALKRSDTEFRQLPQYLTGAEKDGKDIKALKTTVREAVAAHITILSKIMKEVPPNFIWTPEKGKVTQLNLEQFLNESVSVRKLII